MLKKIGSTHLFILILILAAGLRFYHLSSSASFDFDQEYAANFAYSVVHDHLKLLIGQPLSVPGLFMGPWYFYFLVPFFALTKLDPIGGAIGSAVFNLTSLCLSFYIVKKVFGDKAALIAAFLNATSYSSVTAAGLMIPSFASSIIALVVWYSFYLYWHNNTKIFPLLFFCFGLFTSLHPILFPLYFVFIILLLIKRKLPSIKTGLFSLITFILPVFPLLLFEYFHKFLEVQTLLHVLTGNSGPEHKSLFTIKEYSQVILRESDRVLNILPSSRELASIIIILVVLFLIFKKVGFWKDGFHKIMLPLTILVYLLYYWFYPQHVPEYYFRSIGSFFLIYLAASLSLLLENKKTKIFLPFILGLIFISNFNLLLNFWNNPSTTSLQDKKNIVQKVLSDVPPKEEYFVSYITTPGWGSGFDYLFKISNHPPQRNVAKPPVYTIVAPKTLSIDSINYSSGNIGLILPH